MELVYLWVEDYKNIHKQGFNFSTRFKCKYDENSNELTIDENKDYVSIFPDNINITAIVGENGSGKSNLLEKIQLLIKFLKEKEDYKNTSDINKFLNNEPTYKNNYVLLFHNNINNKLLINTNIKNDFQIEPIKDIETQFYFSMTNGIHKSNHRLKNGIYHENAIIYNKPNTDENIIDLQLEEKQDIKNIIYLINDKNTPFNSNFFKPDKFFIYFNHQKLYKSLSPESVNIMSLIEFFEKNKNYIMLLKFTNLLYLIQLTNEYHKYMRTPKLGDTLDLKTITPEEINVFIENINYTKFNSYISNELRNHASINSNLTNELSKIQELVKAFEFFDLLYDFENFIADYDSEFEINIEKFIKNDFINKLPDYFEFDFISKENIRFNNLSTGEQDSLKLIYSIKDIIRKRDYTTSNYYILLDEIGNSLHPNWQKKLINDLILLFDLYKDKTFHLIMTTHSPFILSDLPKENIIFLEKGKQEKPFKENEQTFGANIHTLLSHGFFMDGGLMGEFAKSKISDVIELLKKEQLSEDEIKSCKHIISIIGEPILQKTLEHQLSEKLNPNETELQKLEREQKEIQAKIDKLTGKNNEKD